MLLEKKDWVSNSYENEFYIETDLLNAAIALHKAGVVSGETLTKKMKEVAADWIRRASSIEFRFRFFYTS